MRSRRGCDPNTNLPISGVFCMIMKALKACSRSIGGWPLSRLIILVCTTGLCASMRSAESSADADHPRTGPRQGYYRFPAIHGKQIVFTAEGDLWRVGVSGGVAQRLTTHPGDETHPSFSPDGRTLAFSAEYEGPTEVYTMPAEVGLPTRRTFEGGGAEAVGWTPDGKVLYS